MRGRVRDRKMVMLGLGTTQISDPKASLKINSYKNKWVCSNGAEESPDKCQIASGDKSGKGLGITKLEPTGVCVPLVQDTQIAFSSQ